LIETDHQGKELGTKKLSDWIAEEPFLRSGSADGTLPYLLKILSIAQPLSIQAHPDKELAKKLHAERPDIYKDPNHKPEIAIALTPFSALCGFRELNEIAFFLESVKELRSVIGEEHVNEYLSQYQHNGKEALKKIMHSLLTKDKEFVKQNLSSLVNRLQSGISPSCTYIYDTYRYN